MTNSYEIKMIIMSRVLILIRASFVADELEYVW